MALFLSWLVFASVQLAATMAPGPAFVMAVRNSIAYGRRAGVFTALGLGVGVAVHAALVLCGLALIIAKSAFLFDVIRYAGAAYLLVLGIKAIRAKKQEGISKEVDVEEVRAQQKKMGAANAFFCGVLTNALNPKAVLFFTAVFTQFISPQTSVEIKILYGFTSFAIEFLWFAGVAIILSDPRIKARFMAGVHWVERACGGLMIALGIKLALSR